MVRGMSRGLVEECQEGWLGVVVSLLKVAKFACSSIAQDEKMHSLTLGQMHQILLCDGAMYGVLYKEFLQYFCINFGLFKGHRACSFKDMPQQLDLS